MRTRCPPLWLAFLAEQLRSRAASAPDLGPVVACAAPLLASPSFPALAAPASFAASGRLSGPPGRFCVGAPLASRSARTRAPRPRCPRTGTGRPASSARQQPSRGTCGRLCARAPAAGASSCVRARTRPVDPRCQKRPACLGSRTDPSPTPPPFRRPRRHNISSFVLVFFVVVHELRLHSDPARAAAARPDDEHVDVVLEFRISA